MKRYKICLSIVLAFVTAFSLCTTAFAVDTDYMAEHGEEGQRLWDNFVSLTADKEYDISGFERLYSKYTYHDEDECTTMNPHDAYYWVYCVIPYVSAETQSDWTRTQGDNTNTLLRIDGENIANAYDELETWLMGYWIHTGRLYNFIEDKDSLDYINERYASESQLVESKVVVSNDTDDTSSVISSNVVSDVISDNGSNSSAFSSSFISSFSASNSSSRGGEGSRVNTSLKKSVFTIVIAIVLVGIIAVLICRRKKNNMGNAD